MSGIELLRWLGPVALALGGALVVDFLTRRRGLDPPGFAAPAGSRPEVRVAARGRRTVAMGFLALALYLGVFLPLSVTGEVEPDYSNVESFQLFVLHGFFLFALLVWYVCGFVGVAGSSSSGEGGSWAAQLGWRAPSWLKEVGLGLMAGVGAWIGVLGVLVALSIVLWALGVEDIVPQEPPGMISWIAGLSIGVRLAVSLSAGVVEETFFRGFLQPRVGIGLSTALFTLAHLSYEQPFMLVGVALLSLIFSWLVRWRQSLWAAVTAHALFDALQLLVVIPLTLRMLEGG